MEDEEIIALFWARRESAISETACKYGGLCRSIAYRILSSHADAEECENDTYEAAWTSIPPARPNLLSAFLGRITRNIALDRLDYRQAQKRRTDFDAILSELSECIPSKENVEAQVEQKQTAKLISAYLRTVGEKERAAFIRRYWHSEPVKEVASRFGMSESKVKSLLWRMRRQLKGYLEKEGVTI